MASSGRESIGRWISVLHRIGQIYIASELESLRIGKGQQSFLAALFHRDGISQGELARILHMDKGAVAHALLKLELAGYVRRERDRVDRRVNLVYLTDKARNIEAHLFSVLAYWTDTLAEGLSDEERRQTLALLQQMSDVAATALEKQKERRNSG
ncbi:MAG: winged helix-turn-helix transcriptional regulator [Dehalococcoidia bacterium]|nr:MAG: winged helix-turn-helix transcriptional regulator [Dehalococcoidia bacterium]